MRFHLPKPPSTNSYYQIACKPFARMYISKEGKLWQEEASILLKKQNRRKTPIISSLEVDIYLYTAYGNDVDGVIKPILDSLQKNNIIKNDRQVVRVSSLKMKSKKTEERVEIEIMGYED